MKKTQSIMEYAALLVIAVLAIVGMRVYVIRSIRAHFKVVQDQLNNKNSSLKAVPSNTIE